MLDVLVTCMVELIDAISNFSDGDAPGHTIHGGPDDTNGWGTRPTDVQGNPVGNDVWGRPNNTTIHS